MTFSSPWQGGLKLLVYLSNNWLSQVGVVLVTTAGILWLFLLPSGLFGEVGNPYLGILAFVLLPMAFFAGLAMIPVGILIRRRREHSKGLLPAEFPPLTFASSDLRRLVAFVAATTVANLVIGSHLTYKAVSYMESVSFCGQTCHTVMDPEFSAYQNSPHSRVECVKCHIGPGASWFVKSKLSGTRQLFAVFLKTYETPIPTPVRNLRPARETCEACHWPQKFGSDRLKVIDKFADDETSTHTKSVLTMRIGSHSDGQASRNGIHGVHLSPGVTVRYAHSDETRQTIPWVEYTADGKSTVYAAQGATPSAQPPANMPVRTMDCVDCHNRPTHTFELPDRAVDKALADGDISPSLPFVRKKSVEVLKQEYKTREEAQKAIPSAFAQAFPGADPAAVERSARTVLAIYSRNIFPQMKVTWGTYINNIGHTDFPGCFRCHDDGHVSAGGQKVSQDCDSCHHLLAMEEASPKILTDLGLAK